MEQSKKTQRIRSLNDALRQRHLGGHIMITAGIQALGQDVVSRILSAVARFDEFGPDNDPYGEHDCATLCFEGHSIIWKIDYYDLAMKFASADPADPHLTQRVMTVMLAAEY